MKTTKFCRLRSKHPPSASANLRFIVTDLPDGYADSRALYEDHYCARGEIENRIKEQQLDLFVDRISTHHLSSDQLRLWFSTAAYTLINPLRRIGLRGTKLAKAVCGSIRLKLFKIGAQVKLSVRRILIHFASACLYQPLFPKSLATPPTLPLVPLSRASRRDKNRGERGRCAPSTRKLLQNPLKSPELTKGRIAEHLPRKL